MAGSLKRTERPAQMDWYASNGLPAREGPDGGRFPVGHGSDRQPGTSLLRSTSARRSRWALGYSAWGWSMTRIAPPRRSTNVCQASAKRSSGK